jgi:hypothetical protein
LIQSRGSSDDHINVVVDPRKVHVDFVTPVRQTVSEESPMILTPSNVWLLIKGLKPLAEAFENRHRAFVPEDQTPIELSEVARLKDRLIWACSDQTRKLQFLSGFERSDVTVNSSHE